MSIHAHAEKMAGRRLRGACAALIFAAAGFAAPAMALDYWVCGSNWHVWMKEGNGYRPALPDEVIIRGARKWDTDHWITHGGNPPPLNVSAPAGEVKVSSGGPLRGCELGLMLEVVGKGTVELLNKVDMPDPKTSRRCIITVGGVRDVIDPWVVAEQPSSKCYVIKPKGSAYDGADPNVGKTRIYMP